MGTVNGDVPLIYDRGKWGRTTKYLGDDLRRLGRRILRLYDAAPRQRQQQRGYRSEKSNLNRLHVRLLELD